MEDTVNRGGGGRPLKLCNSTDKANLADTHCQAIAGRCEDIIRLLVIEEDEPPLALPVGNWGGFHQR